MPNIRFGNIDFNGDGAYVWGEGQYSAPARSVDLIEVPGRSGDLLIDNGNYTNTKAVFEVAITKDVRFNTDRLKYLLYSQKGYQKLYDSDLKGFYRMASFSNGFDISEIDAGIVRVEFDCKPFKYDINGENAVVFECEGYLTNKYFEPSKPIVNVFGRGSGILYINEQFVAIYAIDEYLTIDTELQDAFKDGQNKNGTINSADLVLEPGKNKISFEGGISRVEIVPRWVTV